MKKGEVSKRAAFVRRPRSKTTSELVLNVAELNEAAETRVEA
jgi:hypothetical protein